MSRSCLLRGPEIAEEADNSSMFADLADNNESEYDCQSPVSAEIGRGMTTSCQMYSPASHLVSGSTSHGRHDSEDKTDSAVHNEAMLHARPHIDDHRYSMVAKVKASSEQKGYDLSNTREFYSLNKIAPPQPNASSGDLMSDFIQNDKVINLPEPVEAMTNVHFKDLFRYATRNDKIILAFSLCFAVCGGALLPLMPIIFSQFAKSFLQVGTTQPVNSILIRYTLYYVYLAAVMFVVICCATYGLIRTGERLARRTREEYLASLLRQDIDYFNQAGVGTYAKCLTEKIDKIQQGISERIAYTVHALSTFTCAFIVAFVLCWRLALMLLWSAAAGVIVCGGVYLTLSHNPKIEEAESRATSIAEEAVSSIRNIKAMGAETRVAQVYDQALKEAGRWATKQSIQLSSSYALTITVNYLNIALILWQGSRFIARNEATFTDVFIIELVMTQAIYALIGISKHIEKFSNATGAAQEVFQTIERKSKLDVTSGKGTLVNPLVGTIKFVNVSFYYPSRPNVQVLSNINLCFPAGKTTALVGASGSGKSSIIDLILRFYDPQSGDIVLDSVDLFRLNLRWLRRQIGVVDRNPTMFATTIKENIRYGLIGSGFEYQTEHQQFARILEAAHAANIHNDIVKLLPERYETQVGDRGFTLSGGQKQRIALARALVANPQILLLDEATSAVDSESEEKITSLLNSDKAHRTTIIVAHRLSTIKEADNIIVLDKGTIAEQGSHNELMQIRGAYYQLVQAGKSADMNDKAMEEYTNRKVSGGSASSSDSVHNPIRPLRALFAMPAYPAGSLNSSNRSTPTPNGTRPSFYPGESQQNLNPRGEATSDVELDVLGPNGWVRSLAEPPNTSKAVNITGKSVWSLIRFAVGFNSGETWLNSVGIVCCFFGGAKEAVNAILFGESTVSLSLPRGQYTEMLSQVAMFAWVYLGFALFQFVVYGGLAFTLNISAQRMVRRVKATCFRSALRQDIEFYDAIKSSSGAFVSILTTETRNMCGLSGATLGDLMVVASTLLTAIFIGIGFGWKLALVTTATVPLVLGCGYLSVAFLGQHLAASNAEVRAAAKHAIDALANMRTVAILTREGGVLKQYCRQLRESEKKSLGAVIKVSLTYAACQSLVFLCMALGFWFGGTLVAKGEYSALQFFVVFTSVIFGSRSASFFFSSANDISNTIVGTEQVKNLLERKVKIDTWCKEGIALPTKILGSIQFSRVEFTYPGHDQAVLRKLSFTVMPGKHIALVGPNGCGKSTIIGLIERFYNPVSGYIMVDGEDIRSYRLEDYRCHISLVSQDISLYRGTIRDNIVLGVDEIPGYKFEKDLQAAIACANLTEFIASLPQGIFTELGSKGCQLSRGQRQRISIARAVLRNPAILLLDKATSALDSESERIVQRALDKAREGRTTITITHRVDTIRHADTIYFLENGRVSECGSHDELMKLAGRYSEFVKLQEMAKEVEKIKLAASTSFVDRNFIEELTSKL